MNFRVFSFNWRLTKNRKIILNNYKRVINWKLWRSPILLRFMNDLFLNLNWKLIKMNFSLAWNTAKSAFLFRDRRHRFRTPRDGTFTVTEQKRWLRCKEKLYYYPKKVYIHSILRFIPKRRNFEYYGKIFFKLFEIFCRKHFFSKTNK